MYSLKDCEPGHIVSTGDSYGMDLCICLGDDTIYGKPGKKFLSLQDWRTHISSYRENEVYEDDCYYITRIRNFDINNYKQQILNWISNVSN